HIEHILYPSDRDTGVIVDDGHANNLIVIKTSLGKFWPLGLCNKQFGTAERLGGRSIFNSFERQQNTLTGNAHMPNGMLGNRAIRKSHENFFKLKETPVVEREGFQRKFPFDPMGLSDTGKENEGLTHTSARY